MTLLGKVFTGLIFLLSVIFFAIAVMVNASHIDQKDRADTAESDLSQSQQANRQLQAQLEEVKTELAIEQAARRLALASLQTQYEEAQSSYEEKEKEAGDLNAQVTELIQVTKGTQADLKAKLDDNRLLREQIVNARQDRDQLFQRLVSAKDEYNRLQGIYQSLLERERALAGDYTGALEKLQILNIDPNEELLAPPEVRGEVVSVGNNLVEVNLGRDDGLRKGYELDVHNRNGQYLGKLKITTVRQNASVAEILTNYRKGYIRAGDLVDSKLY